MMQTFLTGFLYECEKRCAQDVICRSSSQIPFLEVECGKRDEDEVLNVVKVFTGGQIWISHRRCHETAGIVDHGACGLKGAISSMSVSGYRL